MELLHFADPTLIVDGEIMADDALSPEIIEQSVSVQFAEGWRQRSDFPRPSFANIACKLLPKIGGRRAIGPILMGMSRPVHVLQRNATVEDIVNVAAIAVVDAQENEAESVAPGRAAARAGNHVSLRNPARSANQSGGCDRDHSLMWFPS